MLTIAGLGKLRRAARRSGVLLPLYCSIFELGYIFQSGMICSICNDSNCVWFNVDHGAIFNAATVLMSDEMSGCMHAGQVLKGVSSHAVDAFGHITVFHTQHACNTCICCTAGICTVYEENSIVM